MRKLKVEEKELKAIILLCRLMALICLATGIYYFLNQKASGIVLLVLSVLFTILGFWKFKR